jgi:hypothetical protein
MIPWSLVLTNDLFARHNFQLFTEPTEEGQENDITKCKIISFIARLIYIIHETHTGNVSNNYFNNI